MSRHWILLLLTAAAALGTLLLRQRSKAAYAPLKEDFRCR